MWYSNKMCLVDSHYSIVDIKGSNIRNYDIQKIVRTCSYKWTLNITNPI